MAGKLVFLLVLVGAGSGDLIGNVFVLRLGLDFLLSVGLRIFFSLILDLPSLGVDGQDGFSVSPGSSELSARLFLSLGRDSVTDSSSD